MQRAALIFVLICGLLGASAAPVLAQDQPEPTLESGIDADESALEALALSVEEAAARADEAAQEAEAYAAQAADAIDLGFNLLGLFEVITALFGIAVPVLAILGGLFGYSRLRALNNRLDSAEQLVSAQNDQVEEMRSIYNALIEMRAQIEENERASRREFERRAEELNHLRDRMTESLEHVEVGLEAQRRESANAILALALLPLGERQYRINDSDGALDTYRRALALDAKNPAILYRLGYVYAQIGRLEDAQSHLRRALEIDTEFAPALAALGFVYRRIAEKRVNLSDVERSALLAQAEHHLLQALQTSPKLVDEDGESWWGSLGGLYRRRGQIDEAITAYRRAAEVTPYSSYPFGNLALLYMNTNVRGAMLDTYKDVERLARREVQGDPDNYWAYADLLVARLALSKIQEAEETLGFVLDKLPKDSPYAAATLIDTLEQLEQVLGEAPHITRVIARIREQINPEYLNPAARNGADYERLTIEFESGARATALLIPHQIDLDLLVQMLDIDAPRPTIFIYGGALNMSGDSAQTMLPLIEAGLVKFAELHGTALVDGGTSYGVMQLIGAGRRRSRGSFPLIGVAPIHRVKYPGRPNPGGEALDENHSHFVLTHDDEFGDETEMIARLAGAIARNQPLLGIVINGGDLTRQDVYRLVTEDAHIPLLILEGSGRFADDVAEAVHAGTSSDPMLQTIITRGNLRLVHIDSGPEGLAAELNSIVTRAI
ncbi:MAG: tetratricopeptide repeat protein [Chloroflexi bacterium]|nr:tetratricopeptide repeat protein [Chloroflexota bacterium]